MSSFDDLPISGIACQGMSSFEELLEKKLHEQKSRKSKRTEKIDSLSSLQISPGPVYDEERVTDMFLGKVGQRVGEKQRKEKENQIVLNEIGINDWSEEMLDRMDLSKPVKGNGQGKRIGSESLETREFQMIESKLNEPMFEDEQQWDVKEQVKSKALKNEVEKYTPNSDYDPKDAPVPPLIQSLFYTKQKKTDAVVKSIPKEADVSLKMIELQNEINSYLKLKEDLTAKLESATAEKAKYELKLRDIDKAHHLSKHSLSKQEQYFFLF